MWALIKYRRVKTVSIGRRRLVIYESLVARERQRDIIRDLGQPSDASPDIEEIVKELVRATKRTAA
jgi:hypothetical protein